MQVLQQSSSAAPCLNAVATAGACEASRTPCAVLTFFVYDVQDVPLQRGSVHALDVIGTIQEALQHCGDMNDEVHYRGQEGLHIQMATPMQATRAKAKPDATDTLWARSSRKSCFTSWSPAAGAGAATMVGTTTHTQANRVSGTTGG